MRFPRDVGIVFAREFAPVPRQPFELVFAMVQPLLFLLLFGSLLTGSGAGVWQWFVPGVLIMMCVFGPMMAGYSLLVELLNGSLERLLVTPLSRPAMLAGRVLKEFVILLVQAVFPLVLLSGVLLPLDAAPGWMRAVAVMNPLRYVVDAERALLDGRFAAPSVLYGLVAAGAVAVVGLACGTRAMRRAV